MTTQTEIERKFLVKGPFAPDADAKALVQGYIAREDGRTVRVRRSGDDFTLTIKGPSRRHGSAPSRLEIEVALDATDGLALLEELCATKIEKIRHKVPGPDGRIWEVDVFAGANAGLVMAEIELEAANAAFVPPDWAGREVTDDDRFYNASLLDYPIARWRGAFEALAR